MSSLSKEIRMHFVLAVESKFTVLIVAVQTSPLLSLNFSIGSTSEFIM